MFETLSDTVRSKIRAWRRRESEIFIRDYQFPSGIRTKLAERLQLSDPKAINRLLDGLRDYFLLCLDRRDLALGMPSQGVDAAWHEFILWTRDYTRFCEQAFGQYLHHIPNDEPEPGDRRDYWGDLFTGAGRVWSELGNTWFLSCMRMGQDPHKPTEIPRLFTLDFELGVGSGRMLSREDLASLPIPSCFIETEPGRYRYSAWKKRKARPSSTWWAPAGSGTWVAGAGGCGGASGHHGAGGHGHGGGCGGGGGSSCGGGCGGGGG
jgi:hypothetical protein